MAEVQRTSSSSAEMAQRFIEFIMIQAENAVLMLGLQPHPGTGQTMRNLKMARIYIDHLEMIREKTRGNLSGEESKILTKMLGDLQFEYVRISGDLTAYDTSASAKEELDDQPAASSSAAPVKAAAAPKSQPQAPQPPSAPESIGGPGDADRKVRFTKSYG